MKTPTTSIANSQRLAFVTDGREAIGFVLNRGKAGFEAFNRAEQSLGVFPTAPAAANAIFDNTQVFSS
jgi:hypothetical protein